MRIGRQRSMLRRKAWSSPHATRAVDLPQTANPSVSAQAQATWCAGLETLIAEYGAAVLCEGKSALPRQTGHIVKHAASPPHRSGACDVSA
jgi:hypothetical protein